tara:strand:- start:26060 stop:26992 length:933 start_codon:yes stop_codon:yes gene_type:complete
LKVHYETKSLKEIKNPVVTVGTFDGVHLGHQKILSRLKKLAKKNNGETVLLTFDPHPRKVLFKNHNLKLINSLDEKIKILEKLKLDHLVVQPFTKSFSKLSAKEYVEELLVKKLNTKTLVIGYDHHFGNDRKGNIELLKKLQTTYQYQLEEITAHEIDEIKISSTKIRQAIETGNVKLVYDYSGNHLQFSGKIIKGDGIGKTIDYPTANIELICHDKIIPLNGVYAIKCQINEKNVCGVMNIGCRPTINENNKISIECHLFNWTQDIYNQILHVKVVERIRSEIKFKDLDNLKKQIQKDIKIAKKIFDET